MKLSELKDHYKTYTEMSRQLKLGVSTHRVWRAQGYIPINAQIAIESLTNGKFKASLNDINREDVIEKWVRWGKV